MKRGYWIIHIEVHDPERYKEYVAGATEAYEQYDAHFLVRGGEFDWVEGDQIGERHVVIEFQSLEQAKACYDSETYQKAREHRLAASTGSMVIVEGLE